MLKIGINLIFLFSIFLNFVIKGATKDDIAPGSDLVREIFDSSDYRATYGSSFSSQTDPSATGGEQVPIDSLNSQFAMFHKIKSLDELPALLDKAIAHYGNALTPVVFFDFDDCMAKRRYIRNILGTTYQFDWISSAERGRQLTPTLQAIVAEGLNVSDETWNVVSAVPDVDVDDEEIAYNKTIYQPVSNLSTVILTLKSRYFVIKVCSGLPADSLRLAVLEQNGLRKTDYLYSGTYKCKAEAMLNYILEMRQKSESKENHYLAILVDNDFPEAKEKTGKSGDELAATLSDLVAQTNNANPGSDKLAITGMFVHDTRFESMLAAAKPQIRTEIEHSLEATIAFLNTQKIEQQRVIAANRGFAKKQKSQIKKLRRHRAKVGTKKTDKELKTAISQKIAEASSYKRTYEESVTDAQKAIAAFDQKIAEFSRLLTAWRQSA